MSYFITNGRGDMVAVDDEIPTLASVEREVDRFDFGDLLRVTYKGEYVEHQFGGPYHVVPDGNGGKTLSETLVERLKGDAE